MRWDKICATTLGETAGGLLTKQREKGGLDLGTVGSSIVLSAVLVGLLMYAVIVQKRKVQLSES